jgi:hypothetical protein
LEEEGDKEIGLGRWSSLAMTPPLHRWGEKVEVGSSNLPRPRASRWKVTREVEEVRSRRNGGKNIEPAFRQHHKNPYIP